MASSEKNIALQRVLDDDDAADTAAPGILAQGEAANPEASQALYEEHVARLKAEAQAQDHQNRLRVAQEQLAEYAAQKQQDAADVLSQADALQAALTALLQQAGDSPQVSSAAEALTRLKERLEDVAQEAEAFAKQQAADVERSKRSHSEAEMDIDMDSDSKRVKEGSADELEDDDEVVEDAAAAGPATNGTGAGSTDDEREASNGAASTSYTSFAERAKYIPVRLDMNQRKLLRLLEAALNVSEYTDKVDILSWRNKHGRIHAQIKDICAILSGLLVAADYKKGQALVQGRDFKENQDFFQEVFEVGRRYKIMNPDKMRSEYGKLMYLLMDSSDSHIQDLLEFKCVEPLLTVERFLRERGGQRLLEDPLLETATAEVVAGDRPRYEVQRDIKTKERARDALAKRYRNSRLTSEEVLWAIYSLSDNNSYLLFNRDPIDKMIALFKRYFSPDNHEPGYSLAITGGRCGARLTHNHERQYHYVLQSLTLWREISTDMFKLWYLAETDMLSEGNSYRLTDTGQGLNRVQAAPRVSRAMHAILARCQSMLGGWVGSSVIHLGDHNVPNALMFIDKYTQVPRILNPVVMVLDQLPTLYRDANLKQYIDSMFGGLEQCRKAILCDFCKHAFDGSGADNFFDAGSCIDGRLTSAWNWCSRVEKKDYYPVFKLAGFTSFDGDFQK